MTDKTTQALLPVTVTQADRDLIVTLMRPLAKNAIEHKAIDFIAEGRGDDAEAVQLVAKHRLAHSLPSQADAGVGLERQGYVATVPPDCDRIVWRGNFYGLAALTPTSGEEMRLREGFAEAFDILVDVQSALVLTADYSDGATVANFVSSSTEYDRLNKFLHSRQDADPRAALTKGAE